MLTIKSEGFGRRKKVKIIKGCVVSAILWCIWLERNAWVMQGISMSLEILWDKIRFFCLLFGAQPMVFLKGVAVSGLHRD